jgi:hypothetical protein
VTVVSTSRLLLSIAALTLALASAASAATSHVKLWSTPAGAIVCGYEIHAASKPATSLLCSSALIPAPSGERGVGDPGFVSLSKSGSPRRLRLSQNSFAFHTSTTLPSGAIWSGLGVRCAVTRNSVRCVNGAGHGFKITGSRYTAF